jgi:hypothetical protein
MLQSILDVVQQLPFPNYFLLALLPILGFLISRWKNDDPKGLLNYQSLSNSISQNPSWHLPLIVIGVIMSFAINIIVYSYYFILFMIHYLGVVIEWIYVQILKHIIDVALLVIRMIIDIILLLINLLIRYLVNIPIEIFLAVIHAVPYSLNWTNYKRTFKVIIVGSLLAAIAFFAGGLTETPIIGYVGAPFILVITITYLVGLVSFNDHSKGRTAAIFAMMVVGLIITLGVAIFGSNMLDAHASLGGIFAGLWYSPSVLGIMAILILVITVLFISNVGAIFINREGSPVGFKNKLSGMMEDAFRRSWFFLFQPLFVMVIGAILCYLPYKLMEFSGSSLQNYVIQTVMNDKADALNSDLKINAISSRINTMLSNEKITDQHFKLSLDTLSSEMRIYRDLENNSTYSSYLQSTTPISELPGVIMSQLDQKNRIKKSEEQLESLKKVKQEDLKIYDDQLKEATVENGYVQKDIDNYKKQRDRTEMLYSEKIKNSEIQIANYNSSKWKYTLTFLIFLLGKGLLFAIITSLLLSVYAASVMPVYSMYGGSFVAEKVSEMQSKDRRQPWVGLLVIGILVGGYFFRNDIIEKAKSFLSWESGKSIELPKENIQTETAEIETLNLDSNNENMEDLDSDDYSDYSSNDYYDADEDSYDADEDW